MPYVEKIKFILLINIFVFLPFTILADWQDGGVRIDSNLASSYEPSGIVYHSVRETLFMVSDDGWITETDLNGAIINHYDSSSYDLEGITVADANTDYIYVGIEQRESIREFNISTWEFTGKAWYLDGYMNSTNNSQGLEALTFVSNDSGGLFYAGLQENGKIYVFDINLDVSEDVEYIEIINTSINTDLSGLHFHEELDLLYAVFDSSDKYLILQTDGTEISENSLPGSAQEGITIVPGCPEGTTTLFIGQDSGEVYKYDEFLIDNSLCQVDDQDPESPDEGEENDQDEELEEDYTPTKVKNITVPKKTKKKKKAKVKWKKQANATGYIIQLQKYKPKTKKYKKIRTIKVKKNKANKLVKKLKANTKYRIKVRAKRTVDGTTYKGTWSKYKKFKTKEY